MGGNKVIAIDLGGTNMRTALVVNNKIKKFEKKSTPKEKSELLAELEKSISKLMRKNVRGIGVASPGPLDSKKGVIKNPPNLPLRNFNLKKHLEKKFRVPVRVENDANCVALAELKVGCKKSNFFIMTLGTGIGGGIVIDKKVYSGEGFGGELGHIVVDDGNYLETVWQRRFKETERFFGKKLTIKELLSSKDRKAKVILNKITNYLGQGVGSLINVFDPEVVVLAGGVKETGNKYMKMISSSTQKYIALPKKTKIRWSKLNEPGVIGASLLI